LKAARAQANEFERNPIEATIKPTLDKTALERIKSQLSRITGIATVRVRLDRESLAAIRAQINRSVGTINVRARLDNASLVGIRERINRSVGTISVRVRLDPQSLVDLRARIAALRYTATINLKVDDQALRNLRTNLGGIDAGFRNSSQRATEFGNAGASAFERVSIGVRAVLVGLPALLPLLGSATVAAVGLGGALVSAFGIAAVGIGAFGIVAASVFGKVQEGADKSYAEIAKLPNGIRQASFELKKLKEVYDSLVTRNQADVGMAMAAGFKAAATALNTLDPIIKKVSQTLTIIGNSMNTYFQTDHWNNFVKFVAGTVQPILLKLFDVIAYGTRAVMNLVVAFQPLAEWVLDGIVNGMKEFAKWTEQLGKDQGFQAFIAMVKESLPRVWELIKNVAEFLFKLAMALAPVGNLVLDVLNKIFEGLNKIPPEFLGPIAIALAGIFAALALGATGPVGIVVGVILGLAAAFKMLYDRSKTLQDFFSTMVTDLKAWFQPFWEKMTDLFNTKVKPAWDDLVTVIKEKFMPVLKTLWDKFKTEILPALEQIATVIMEKLIPAFLEFFKAVAPIIAWLWENLGKHAIEVIGRLVQIISGGLTMVSGVFKTITGLITGDWEKFGEGLKGIAEGFWTAIAGIFGMNLDQLKAKFHEWDQWIMTKWQEFTTWISDLFSDWANRLSTEWSNFWNGVRDFFNGIVTWITDRWNNFWTTFGQILDNFIAIVTTAWTNFWNTVRRIAEEIWTFLQNGWNNWWTTFRQILDNFVQIVSTTWSNFWNGVRQVAIDIWEAIKSGISNALNWVRDRVSEAGDQIGAAWRKVANFFREPINWVIRVVINDGIFEAWNTVMGWIGAEGLKATKLGEIPAFAKGGPVTGGRPNQDSVQAWLMPGEYVLSKRAIANMGGLSMVDQLHQSARKGFTSPVAGMREGQTAQSLMAMVPMDGLGFAYGGVQPHVAAAGDEIVRVFGPMPGGIGGVGARANASDHPTGHALDFMTLSNVGLGNQVADYLYANAARMALKYEIWLQRIRNPGGGWVGMENRGSPTANHMDHVHASFLGGAGSAGANIGGAATAQIVSWWSQIGSKVEGLFGGLKNLIPGMPGGGAIGNAMKAIPGNLIQKALDMLREKLMNMFTTIFTPAGSAAMGAISGAVQDQVRAVAARYGWGDGPQWEALATIIQRESSWNPAAANPNSSARGLFQKMTSLHGPVEPTVTGQAEWGLNYIKGRYGDPVNALAYHNAHGNYRNGGWLMPGAYSHNETYEPEAIFNRPQISAMHEAIRNAGRRGALDDEFVQKIIDALGRGNGEGGVNIGSVTLPYGASVKELSDECFFRVHHGTKGRYGR
jgi:phage-related protein